MGTAALAEVIKFNTTIRDVSLANTVLNAQGCALLADALFMNRNLASLNLEKNRVGAAGAKFLASALSANESLRRLFLDGNDIGDPGAISLAAALSPEGGSRLERLSLANTGITEAGAAALGDALVGNFWLQKLVVNKQDLEPQVLQGRAAAGGVTDGDGASLSSRGLQVPTKCECTLGAPCLSNLVQVLRVDKGSVVLGVPCVLDEVESMLFSQSRTVDICGSLVSVYCPSPVLCRVECRA